MKNEDLNDRIKEYENNDETTEYFLGGRKKKRFVILEDNSKDFQSICADKDNIFKQKSAQDSHFFKQLFDDLMGGKSHYITYFNDLIVNKQSNEIYIPQYVSCLIKGSGNFFDMIPDFFISETMGSRLANEFGIDTVYNIPHPRPIYDEELKYLGEDRLQYDEYDYLISVDCIPNGYKMENFLDLGINFGKDALLEERLNKLDKNFLKIAREQNLKIDMEMLGNVKHDLAKQYLFRMYICDDFDFRSENVGLLMSDNGDFRLAPCFDMELFFMNSGEEWYTNFRAEQDIKYLAEIMPNLLDEFVETTTKSLKAGRIDELFKSNLNVDSRDYSYKLNLVKSNIRNFEEMVKKFHPEQSMTI